MKSIDSLKKLYATAKTLPDINFLSQESEEKVKDNIEQIENLFIVAILNFLSNGNYKKLVELMNRFDHNAFIYRFVKFASCLCAEETDFEFLTDPINLEIYIKLKTLSSKFKKGIPCYVDILQKICENKSYGIYQEFQEVSFFFNEVEKLPTNKFVDVFENYKRVLKLTTQKIFKEFLSINLFEEIKKIFLKNKNKIYDETILIFYIFGELFFKLSLSNKDENILLKHINFFVQYLIKFETIEFEKKIYNVNTTDLETRLKLFFEKIIVHDESRYIGFLKDFSLNDKDIVNFCYKLREIFDGKSIYIKFDGIVNKIENIVNSCKNKSDEKISFFQIMFKIARTENVNLTSIKMHRYKEILIDITEKHFLTVKRDQRIDSDLILVDSYKEQLGDYYIAIKYLIERGIFSKILFTYNYEKSRLLANKIKESIALKYKDFADKNKIKEIISLFYLIIIEKCCINFDVGNSVFDEQHGFGKVIQILKKNFNDSGIFYYRINWNKNDVISMIPVSEAKSIKLVVEKYLKN